MNCSPSRRWLRVRALMLGCCIAGTVGIGFPVLAQHGDHAGHGIHEEHGHPSSGTMDHSAHEAPKATAPRALDGVDIPDVPVTTADGDEVSFFTDLVDGKTVAINFVFTTCTTICPPMGANFARLQKDLGDRVGRDVHLISVSVDPVTDTPERMRAWGDKFGAAPGWTLVTGERAEITRLLKALEVFTADILEHSPVVLMGNEPADEWTRAYGLAPPARLTEILDEMSAERVSEGAR